MGGRRWPRPKLSPAAARATIAVGVLAVGVLAGAGLLPATSSAAAARPAASVRSVDAPRMTSGGSGWSVHTGGISISTVTCQDTSHCTALASSATGGTDELLSTSDGGGKWTSVDTGISGSINAISCPDQSLCIAVGGNPLNFSGLVFRSIDGGATFTTVALPQVPASGGPTGTTEPVSSDLLSVSCISATACWASGNGPVGQFSGIILVTSDGGQTWSVTASSLPSSVKSISCVAPSSCIGVGAGNAFVTTDGVTWTNHVFSTTSSAIQVSCGTTSDCWVLVGGGRDGNNVMATTNGGSTWSSDRLPATNFDSISCSGTVDCSVVGSVPSGSYQPDTSIVASTVDGGQMWNSETSPVGGGLISISCPSASDCWAAGGYTSSTGTMIATNTGGTSWFAQLSGPAMDVSTVSFGSMTCPTATSCWAVGSAPSEGGVVLSSDDAGSDWNVVTTTGSLLPLNDVACADSLHCWVVGAGYGQGFGATILATTDGGATWSIQSAPTTVDYLDTVSCLNTSVCIAVGAGSAIRTQDGGAAWSLLDVGVPGSVYASSLACIAASTDCWLVAGGNIIETTDSGSSWFSKPPPSSSYLDSITCLSTSECWVAGSVNNQLAFAHTTDGGVTWTSSIPTIDNASTPGPISCSDSKDCWVIVHGGWLFPSSSVLATSDGGVTWTDQYASSFTLSGLDCTASTTCTAVGSVSGLGGGGLVMTTSDGGAPPPPVLTLSSPGWAMSNQGLSLTVVGRHLSGTTSVTIGSWKFTGTSITIDSDDQISVSVSPNYVLKDETDPISVTTQSGSTSGGSSAPQLTFIAPKPLSPGAGFWAVNSYGWVSTYGSAPYLGNGNAASVDVEFVGNGVCRPSQPPPCIQTTTLYYGIVGMTGSLDGDGYALVTANGEVQTFGDVKSYGELTAMVASPSYQPLPGEMVLNEPIVGMAATPDGKGYWLVAADGGIFTFGDATYLGSTGAMDLAAPIVGMAATPDGKGYWLVAADGGIFTFGDAKFFGSDVCTCDPPLSPAVALVPTSDGLGYWVVHSDGFVLSHGDARKISPTSPQTYGAATVVPTPDDGGYWLVSNGGVSPFGDAPVLRGFFWGAVAAAT